MTLALEGTPGKEDEARGWELWAPLPPMYEASQYAEVATRHLRSAVEMAKEFRGAAMNDSDLAPIRHEPPFRQLMRDGPHVP